MMKILFCFALTVMLLASLMAQPFQTGHTTITFTDAARNNRQIPTEIYYPADQTGNDMPFTSSGAQKFPVLSFGHGFVMTWDAYQNIWSEVVSEGYVIAFPKTEGNASPSHLEFGKDLAFVLSSIISLGNNSNSLFYNRVDTMTCVMGHSMGGGAAFLAAPGNPHIKALATLAAAETNPSAIQAASGLAIPALLIVGGNDCVTPIANNQQPMYDSLKSDCKTLIQIKGGSHCQMADNNFLCNIGDASCQPSPAITRAAQHAVIRRYLLPWLNYHLKDECDAGLFIESSLSNDTSVLFNKSCQFCTVTGFAESDLSFKSKIFPNPVSGTFYLTVPHSGKPFIAELFTLSGQKIFGQIVIPNQQDNFSFNIPEESPEGLYFLKLSGERLVSTHPIIKQ